jgi:hypothetical protein
MTLLVEMSSVMSGSVTWATVGCIRSFPGNKTAFISPHTRIQLEFPFPHICVDRATAMFHVREHTLNMLLIRRIAPACDLLSRCSLLGYYNVRLTQHFFGYLFLFPDCYIQFYMYFIYTYNLLLFFNSFISNQNYLDSIS